MKEYPSIPKMSHEFIGRNCIGFEKKDGSNLRFKFSAKKGWHMFGTRNRLFDKTDPEYGCAIDIFLQKYASGVEAVVAKDKYFRGVREIVCFCEFLGPFSFGGQHDPANPAVILGGCKGSNEPKDVVMFDVNVHKKGLIPPRDFVNIFSHLPIVKVVYEGVLDGAFIEDVREGRYPVFEGVVCKGLQGRPPHGIWMTKIKTAVYLAELKIRFAEEWEKYL